MVRRLAKLTLPRFCQHLSPFALLVMMLMLCSAEATAAEPAKDEATKKVLIFSSYDPSLPAAIIINENINATLRRNSPVRVQVYQEHLDSSRIQESNYEEALAGFIGQKYGGEKLDLIFALGSPALRMLLKHRADLLPDTPIVFYYFEAAEEAARNFGPNITGVTSKPEFGKTMEIVRTLHPDNEKIVVVAGSSRQDRAILMEARKGFGKYAGGAEFTYLTDLSIDELRQRLASLPENNVVIFLSFFSDREGKSFSGPEALSALAPFSNAPIYAMSRTYLGFGIVGGSLLDFEAIGKRVGEVGLRVLGGERPENIPLQSVPSAVMFDWREMKRWRISEKNLPPGSVVEFKEQSFWEQYKWYIVAVFGVGVIEALLIIRLLINRARRRRAEEALRQSEERLLRAQQAARVGTWEWDLLTGEARWSEGIYELLGLEQGDGKTTLEQFVGFIHPEDRERALKKVESVARSGEVFYDEFRVVRPDGATLWLASKGRVVRDNSGRPERLIGVNIDITERKMAEEALRRTEQKNLDIVRALPDLVFVQTPNGVYVDYHSGETSVLLVPPEEFLGKNMRDVLPPELADAFFRCFRRAEETGEPQVHEYMLMIRGEPSWYEARIIHTDAGHFLSIVRDVTERKRVEAQLTESEERFRNMADTAAVMIWMSDQEKRCIYVNKRWLEFTGRSLEEELENGWKDIVHPEDLDQCLENYNSAFERQEPFTQEVRLHRADGEFRWIRDSAVPRFSPAGKFLGYIGSSIDVTDRKLGEEALEAAYAQVIELKSQLEAENIYLKEELRLEHDFGEIIGDSEAIRNVFQMIEQVASINTTVLILGETGTGKELVAHAIHRTSLRKDKSMIKVNCAALPAALIESELFGHEKGAFTGAAARRLGRFEVANGGTIFLDEIGDLPLELQSKLLRVLQEGEFERLGSTKTIKVNVRVIAATNRDLAKEVIKGTFREDLWYRLNVFPITVPPLRERKEDIPMLVEAFVLKFSKELGKPVKAITSATMNALLEYSWPGNIRELANVIERALINTEGQTLRLADRLNKSRASELPFGRQTLEDLERHYILRVLEETGWRIEGPKGAARILGLNPSTLRTRMVKLGIQRSKDASQ